MRNIATGTLTSSAGIREVYGKLDMETRKKRAPPQSAEAWRKFESFVRELEGMAEGLMETRLGKYQLNCDIVRVLFL